MGLFTKKPIAIGTLRVVPATREDGMGQLVLNGMPQVKVHVSGLLQVDGRPPQATSGGTRSDASVQVLQDLLTTGRADQAGATDPLGTVISDPSRIDAIAGQLAATLGTPISVDIDQDGVKRHITIGGGGHLSSAEATQLQKTGIAATATIDVPATMMPNPEARRQVLGMPGLQIPVRIDPAGRVQERRVREATTPRAPTGSTR